MQPRESFTPAKRLASPLLGGPAARLVSIFIAAAMLAGCHGPVKWVEPSSIVGEPFDPPALYLTWQSDPTTTMTIQWHSHKSDTSDEIVYGEVGDENARSAGGSHHSLTGSDRIVHVVELTSLKPGGEYRFRIGTSREHRFRTMPATAEEPICFIDGGDSNIHDPFERICIQAAKHDPMFAVMGGDIAYTDGKPANISRWCVWLDVWKRTMIDSQGRIIPLLVAIGNHEVQGGFRQTPKQAAVFYELFTNLGSGDGRCVLDFGEYMSLILLDTEHTHPVVGDQTDWLKRTLARRRSVPHVFVSYHVPAWPSVHAESDRVSSLVRAVWAPLFEQYGVDVVFEHHDHAYKRSKLLRDGKVDPDGVLYLGDGAWSVTPRAVKKEWYLARAESINHFILTTITGRERIHQAIDVEGRVFDEFSAPVLELSSPESAVSAPDPADEPSLAAAAHGAPP